MNRTALKNYAPKARREFIQAVTDRAAFYGLTAKKTDPVTEKGDVVIIGGRAFPRVVANQRRSLEDRISRQGFDQVMEAMAYIWFNRFVALRYMELHGYLEHGYRVLSHPEGKATPEIVEQAEHVTLLGLDNQKVIELKLDGTKENELFRSLLVAQCNALHEAIPFLFERIDDETELLLPDNLLHSDSVIRKLVSEIEEEDWKEVEIIGWIYQFYISEKKDQVIGKVVKSEDIPAATQLFTPNWIVKYLVQNTLGRQWLATYPDSPLRKQMEYYIEPAEQTEEVKALLKAITPESLNPEELTLLDPACGSGHILVEAYDVFKAIYQERGYRSRDIPRIILQKNLYGLEIDDRAAQLSAFALLMKARDDDRSIFDSDVKPNILAFEESQGLEKLLRPNPADLIATGDSLVPDRDLFPDTKQQLPLKKQPQESPLASIEPCLRELMKLFEHGKTFGSLIRVPNELANQLPAAHQSIGAMIATGQLWEHRAATTLMALVKQAEMLAAQYDAVVANPPYIGSKFHIPVLKKFLNDHYKGYEKDVFSAFIDRDLAFSKPHGRLAFMSPQVWMFLSSYEDVRARLIEQVTITTLVQPEYNAFWDSAHVTICSYVIQNLHIPEYIGTFIRLTEFLGAELQPLRTLEAINNPECTWLYRAKPDSFTKIPGSPLAFWVSDWTLKQFSLWPPLSTFGTTRLGMTTANNQLFTRHWHEVERSNFFECAKSAKEVLDSNSKWVPYNKGGRFRKWFGNMDVVLNWSNDGFEIKHYGEDQGHIKSTVANSPYYFNECLTWSKVSSGTLAMRYRPPGSIFDVAGACIFGELDGLSLIQGMANSPVCMHFLQALSPTLNFEGGQISSLPIASDPRVQNKVVKQVARLVDVARSDWNTYERSWDFHSLPILTASTAPTPTLESSYTTWITQNRDTIAEMKRLEEENNRLFIDAYGLAAELTPDVPIEQITLTVNPAYRYGGKLTEEEQWTRFRQDTMEELVSYAVGCMMGRYSLDDAPGLVYANSGNEGFDPSQYKTFPADADGIIPLTEVGWFPNDAAERVVEFIAKAWPSEHLEENLKFIAESIGANKGEQPRDTIRRYLSQTFFKDHLQTYKKRPIYWLFSSGKQRAFQCLVYLHRYHEGTLARMRTEYVIPLQGKIAARIEQLASDNQKATSTSHRKKLEKEQDGLKKQQVELQAFDEKLRHFADQRIKLDLDDGVKVNYGKFGDLLAEVKAVCGKSEDEE